MSDLHLRELERRWRESGAVSDEAAYLAERVRAGDLDRDMLDLAAYLGHEPARLALNWESCPEPELMDWITGIVEYGEDAHDSLCRSVRMLMLVEYNRGADIQIGLVETEAVSGRAIRPSEWPWVRAALISLSENELKSRLIVMMTDWALRAQSDLEKKEGDQSKKPGSD